MKPGPEKASILRRKPAPCGTEIVPLASGRLGSALAERQPGVGGGLEIGRVFNEGMKFSLS